MHIRGSYNAPLPLSEHADEFAARLGAGWLWCASPGRGPSRQGSAWAVPSPGSWASAADS